MNRVWGKVIWGHMEDNDRHGEPRGVSPVVAGNSSGSRGPARMLAMAGGSLSR